ncbi:methyltransferase [uncultured Prevotella sp.]|uniref:tRNA1(Val) (adenine(37)-N6)-methyltransferase n=1 Tax=uncultured Prevotella sp. TaxID=159272 RepID=UPI002619707E|nr:methyltransferase [uncultured Prevotella sp.]
MSNSFFRFKQFSVEHSKCAMKVGTDGVLLGAWANGGAKILDIGTGSGLIALFMAQKNADSRIVAIDIDSDAVLQARINIENSKFKDRITVHQIALQKFYIGSYNSIVCNPPFFVNSLKNMDRKKVLARHTDSLSYRELFNGVKRLLDDTGEFSVVLPSSCRSDFDTEAVICGFFPSRICAIKTVSYKPISRYLLAYKKYPVNKIDESVECINNDDMSRSDWYKLLTDDFYLF